MNRVKKQLHEWDENLKDDSLPANAVGQTMLILFQKVQVQMQTKLLPPLLLKWWSQGEFLHSFSKHTSFFAECHLRKCCSKNKISLDLRKGIVDGHKAGDGYTRFSESHELEWDVSIINSKRAINTEQAWQRQEAKKASKGSGMKTSERCV